MRRILACAILAVTGTALAGELPTIDPSAGYIFAASNARSLLKQCSRAVPQHVSGTWLPTRAQIDDLEARLPAALSEVMSKRVTVPYNWPKSDFARQYAGLIVDNRKVIYINAFPKSSDSAMAAALPGWKVPDRSKEPKLVCDGGPDFFGAVFDPATNTFEDFAFNGAI